MTGLSRNGGSSEATMEALDPHLQVCQWRSSLVGHQGQSIHSIISFPCSLASAFCLPKSWKDQEELALLAGLTTLSQEVLHQKPQSEVSVGRFWKAPEKSSWEVVGGSVGG